MNVGEAAEYLGERRVGLNTFSQRAHQHDLLLGLIAILTVSLGLLVRYRRASARLWIAWGAALGLSGAALVALRTPEASLSASRS